MSDFHLGVSSFFLSSVAKRKEAIRKTPYLGGGGKKRHPHLSLNVRRLPSLVEKDGKDTKTDVSHLGFGGG